MLFAAGGLLLGFLLHGLDHPLSVGMDAGSFLAGFRRFLLTYLLGVWIFRAFGDEAPISIPVWVTILLMPAMFIGTWLFDYNRGWLDMAFAALLCPLLLVGGLQLRLGVILRWLERISFPLHAVHTPIMAPLLLYHLPVLLALPLAFASAEILARVTERGTTQVGNDDRTPAAPVIGSVTVTLKSRPERKWKVALRRFR